jgi:outer membrane scaffolding protein for murein synthesis (MipA/OmpV family)
MAVAPQWRASFGAGAIVAPAYPGASAMRAIPLPFVDVRYGERFFANVTRGVGVNLIAERDRRFGLAFVPTFGRSEDADARLRGWGSIGAGAAARVFGEWMLGPMLLAGGVRREIGGSDGTLADASAMTFLPLSQRLFLTGGITLTWADASYNRAYFGVTPLQSSIGSLSPYAASAGFRDVALSLMARWQFDRHWGVQSLAGLGALLGDAASSPLTQRRLQPMAGAFIAYSL